MRKVLKFCFNILAIMVMVIVYLLSDIEDRYLTINSLLKY